MGIFSKKNKNQDGVTPSPSKRGLFGKKSSNDDAYAEARPEDLKFAPQQRMADLPPVEQYVEEEEQPLEAMLEEAEPYREPEAVVPSVLKYTVLADTGPQVHLSEQSSGFKVEQLEACLYHLKMAGHGLRNAAMADSDVNDALVLIASNVALLREVMYTANGHRQNVETFANFVSSMIETLDAQAKHGGLNDAKPLQQLAEIVAEGVTLFHYCSKPGWFARMARSDTMVSPKFEKLHRNALDILSRQGWDDAQQLVELHYGPLDSIIYEDVASLTKRSLRAAGNGLSVDVGMKRIKTDPSARKMVAELIGVSGDDLVLEAIFDQDSAEVIVMADGPLREVECRRLFQPYVDKDADVITYGGFYNLMEDLGLLDFVAEEDKSATVRTTLVEADTDYDGCIDFTEFRAFYTKQPVSMGQVQLRLQATLKLERSLKATFNQFSQLGTKKGSEDEDGEPGLNPTQFNKLCKDCKLMNTTITKEQIDLVFRKVKSKDARRISFPQFVGAIALISAIKGKTMVEVISKLLDAVPSFEGTTTTNYVRLYDDKSTYTANARNPITAKMPNLRLDLSAVVARPPNSHSKPSPRRAPVSARWSKPLTTTRAESPRLAVAARAREAAARGLPPVTPGRGALIVDKTEPPPKPKSGKVSPPKLATAARAEARAAVERANALAEEQRMAKKKKKVVKVPRRNPAKKQTEDTAAGKAGDDTWEEMDGMKPRSSLRERLEAELFGEGGRPDPLKDSDEDIDDKLDLLSLKSSTKDDGDKLSDYDPKPLDLTLDLHVDNVQSDWLMGRDWSDDEIENGTFMAFKTYATINMYDEPEPVLDEEGFRKLLIAANVPNLGVGLPPSSIVSIFDIVSNAVTRLMNYSHFTRALELIAARTAVPARELKQYIAESPIGRKPKTPRTPATARKSEIETNEFEAEPIERNVVDHGLRNVFGLAAESSLEVEEKEEPVAEPEVAVVEEEAACSGADDEGSVKSVSDVVQEDDEDIIETAVVEDEEIKAEHATVETY